MKNLLTNWKTTFAGISMIITAVTHLVFMVNSGEADPAVWKNDLIAVAGGLGLIFAGDATQSQKQVDDAKEQVKTAIETQDTSHITQTKDETKV